MSDPRVIVVTEEAAQTMKDAGVTPEELDDLYRETDGGSRGGMSLELWRYSMRKLEVALLGYVTISDF